jgi:hypothetical protein
MMMKLMQTMLSAVMHLLRKALSFAPTSSAAVHRRQITSESGDTDVMVMSIELSHSGQFTPICFQKSTKFWLHPRATAAALMAYSSVRFQPCAK